MTDTNRDVTLPSGQVLDDAEFERMAIDAETTTADTDRLLERARGGRSTLGNGLSTVLQVRLDPETRRQLDDRAEHDETTASSIVRDALRSWLNASSPAIGARSPGRFEPQPRGRYRCGNRCSNSESATEHLEGASSDGIKVIPSPHGHDVEA